MEIVTVQALAAAISAFAAVCSAVAAWSSFRLASSLRSTNRYATNFQAAAKHEELIAKPPTLLDLHGYTHTELQKLGLGQIEVAYLISSFTSGDLFYRDREVRELTQYRSVLLQSRRVQGAWQHVLKGKFILPGPFSDLVDQYIARNPPTRP